jgi:hypothetical protein
MTPPKTPQKTIAKKPAAKAKAAPKAAEKPRATRAKPTPDAPENEVMRETRAAIAHNDGQKERAGAKLDWKTAAGIGVGSAAVIAALLYANRGKK